MQIMKKQFYVYSLYQGFVCAMGKRQNFAKVKRMSKDFVIFVKRIYEVNEYGASY